MPEAVARRYRQGEETISQDHQDVSVVYADIVGFDALSAQLPSEQSLALLNELVRSFDEAADQAWGGEDPHLRTGYLASVGLTVPRVDNSRRAVDFAMEMDSIVGRFNGLHATTLSLRAGVDTGTVTSGLVGRSTVVYDMWGDAVNLANQVQSVAGRSGIFVTGRVYDQMRDVLQLQPGRRHRHQIRRAAGLARRDGRIMTSIFDQPWFGWALAVVIGCSGGRPGSPGRAGQSSAHSGALLILLTRREIGKPPGADHRDRVRLCRVADAAGGAQRRVVHQRGEGHAGGNAFRRSSSTSSGW